MKSLNSKGFTLIEVLIVVSIVAILGGLAIASYNTQILKSQRNCGKAALMTISTQQEKNFFQFNQYSNDVVDLFGADECEDGHYQLSVNFSRGGDACSAVNNCYTATAQAVGRQLEDDSCQQLTVDNLGVKASLNADGEDSTATCW